MVRGAH